MIKLPLGKNRGRYTIQKSYTRNTQLTATWRWLGGFSVGITVLIALFCVGIWKTHGSRVMNDYIFESTLGYRFGTAASNTLIIAAVLFLMCFIMAHTLVMAKESKASWPNIVGGFISTFIGAIGITVTLPLLRTSLDVLPEVDSSQKLYEKYQLTQLDPETIEILFSLYGYATYGTFSALMCLSLIFFLLAFFGLTTISEVFERAVLPAKTTQPLRIEFYDNLSRTRKSLLKIVAENVGENTYTKEELDAYYEATAKMVRGETTLVLYEGKNPIAFLVRSHDYTQLQAVWVTKKKHGQGFGPYLMNDYLQNATMRIDPTQRLLTAYVEPHNEPYKQFLLNQGWTATNETDSRGHHVYNLTLPPKEN